MQVLSSTYFFSDINSYYQTADLNVFFQGTFLTKFSKETVAVTLLFQSNFLLVVGADNLIRQFYFYFYRILRNGAGSILKCS